MRVCWAVPGTHDLLHVPGVKTRELGNLAACVFAIDLDHGGDEELLLLVRLGLPEVWLPKDDKKARFGGPFLVVGGDVGAGEGLDAGEVVEIPGLPDGEGAVGVLLGLVHADATGLANGDDDDTRLLGVGGASLGRWRRGGMGGILGDADVGDVSFLNYSIESARCLGRAGGREEDSRT